VQLQSYNSRKNQVLFLKNLCILTDTLTFKLYFYRMKRPEVTQKYTHSTKNRMQV